MEDTRERISGTQAHCSLSTQLSWGCFCSLLGKTDSIEMASSKKSHFATGTKGSMKLVKPSEAPCFRLAPAE